MEPLDVLTGIERYLVRKGLKRDIRVPILIEELLEDIAKEKD